MEKQSEYTQSELEKIFKEIWNLNATGNKSMTYNKFLRVIESGVEPKSILKRYNQYIASMSPFQNTKYTKKEYTIVNLYTFLNTRMYENEFSMPVKRNINRDKYLYGI